MTATADNQVEPESLSLKWGTWKSYNIGNNERARKILDEYFEEGCSLSAMAQRDSDNQKRLLCELIDVMNIDHVYLDWDGVDVSKEKAKEYIMNYGKKE